jgi:hypothetical protein
VEGLAVRKLAVGSILALAALGIGVPAFAHGVPNEKNWHIHDGLGPGPAAGDHHAGLSIFPALFAQEGLVDGSSAAPYVWCTNATDKGLLAPGGQGKASAAGHCASDVYLVHLLRGVEAPAGWSTVETASGVFHYLLTPLP